MSSTVEIVSSSRSTALIFEKFKYVKHKTYSSGDILWRCAARAEKCPATVTTNSLFNHVIKTGEGVHNHAALNPTEIEKEQVRASIKHKALDDISTRPNKIMRGSVAECEHIGIQHFKAMRKTIYRARTSKIGKLPKSLEETLTAASSKLNDAQPKQYNPAAKIEDEPLMDVPSGACSIVIKQEPSDGEEGAAGLWTTNDLVSNDDIPVKLETDPISGEPIPFDLDKDDLLYFRSLVPDLIKLTPELKQKFRIKVRNILKELTT